MPSQPSPDSESEFCPKCGRQGNDLGKWFECEPCNWEWGYHASPELVSESQSVDVQGKLVEALRLILPMAKGYARIHDVGSNAFFIQQADEALALLEGEQNQDQNNPVSK